MKKVETMIAEVDKLYVKGQDSRALKKIEKLLKIFPLNTEVLVLKGRILFQLNQTKNALKFYNRAISINPKSGEAFLERGRYYYSLKQKYKKALADILTAISLSKRDVWVMAEGLRLKGHILSALNHHREALKAYRAAIKLSPAHAEIYCDLADTLSILGQFKKALENYDVALKLALEISKPNQFDISDIIYRKVLSLNSMGKFEYSLNILASAMQQLKIKAIKKELHALREETIQLKKVSDEKQKRSRFF